jgi:protein ImuA
VAGGGHGAIDGAAAALFAAGIAARLNGKVLWCITRADLFGPALAQAGLGPDRVIYLEAGDDKTVLSCFEEGLRHGGLGGRRRGGSKTHHDRVAPAAARG